jgi:NAD dependent epimerase/dehydratase family enzyme
VGVLVTGATGRLGQALVARLQAEGRDVRILTRRPYRAIALFGDGLPIHEWHPLSEEAPPQAIAGVTAVAHLMGEPLAGRPTADKIERIRASRLTATARLAAAFAGRHVRIVAASVPYLDRIVRRETVDESEPRGKPKTALEGVAQAYETALETMALQGASVAIVRLGLLLADDTLATPARLAGWRLGLDLRQALIPAIDIEDAAALFGGLLDRDDVQGFVHGIAPEPLRGEDLMALLAAASGAMPRMKLPQRLARRSLGELMPFLLNGSHIVPRRLMEAGAVFLHPDPKASVARILAQRTARSDRKLTLWPFARATASS